MNTLLNSSPKYNLVRAQGYTLSVDSEKWGFLLVLGTEPAATLWAGGRGAGPEAVWRRHVRASGVTETGKQSET